MTRGDVEEKIAALEDEREEIETALADIRGQIAQSSAKFHAGEGGKDPSWYARAKSALRYKGADHQSVLRQIGKLRLQLKEIRQDEENNKPKDKPFSFFFYKVAESQLDPDLLRSLHNQAMALKEVCDNN